MKVPLANSTFRLDVAGVAGFFGGQDTCITMLTFHLMRWRRWLGWYNSPGGLVVASKFGALANSKIWNALFPGDNVDPSVMVELDGKIGPKFVAAQTGIGLPSTGHLAYLFTQHCNENPGPVSVIGDELRPRNVYLTIAHLKDGGAFEGYYQAPPFDLIAIIPIGVSFGTCVLCAVFRDWFAFALILLGILSNGIWCVVFGSGILKVKAPTPSSRSPPGDGILEGDSRAILLKGNESAVQFITKGRYCLEFASAPSYNDVGWSAVLLSTQFIAQLFIISHSTLFGQIMFLSSLAVSWLYNKYLVALDNEMLQGNMLNDVLRRPVIQTVCLPTRTALVVFTAVYTKMEDPKSFFDVMIPNNTGVWKLLKEIIAEAILTEQDPIQLVASKADRVNELDIKDRPLLHDMLHHASVGYHGVKQYRNGQSGTSSVKEV